MDQFEVPAYLAAELPEIKEDLIAWLPDLNLIKSIQCLTEYTRNMLVQNDLPVARKCFLLAEDIYAKGDPIVMDIVENVFVYSFSAMLNLCKRDVEQPVSGLVPLSLYTAYIRRSLKAVNRN